MKLFYTGATSYNVAQKDKDKSLGGYKSSTEVPNDLVNNLFGDVSMYGLDEKLRETRAIILYNDSVSALTNLYIYFDKLADSLGTFKIAAVALTPVSGEVFMESIQNVRATPYVGTFVEADGVGNKQLLSASLAAGAYLGLWFRRELTSADKQQFSSSNLLDKFDNQEELLTEGKVEIKFEWT